VTYFNLADILKKNLFLFPISPAEFIGNVLPNRQCAAVVNSCVLAAKQKESGVLLRA
jgi:hypothetical protein